MWSMLLTGYYPMVFPYYEKMDYEKNGMMMKLNKLYKQADYKDRAGMMFNLGKNYFDVTVKRMGR